MDLRDAAVKDFLSNPYLAKVATINGDGSPQLTFVWFERADDGILVSTTRDRVKARNLARDPRATIGIEDPGNPWRWVIVSGRVNLETEGAHELIERLSYRYLPRDRAEAYSKQTRTEPRVTLHIMADKVRTLGFQ